MSTDTFIRLKGFSTLIIALIVGAILVIGAAGFYLMRPSEPEASSATSEERTTSDNTTAGETTSTMPDIIGRGESLECDWRMPVEGENPFTTGKLFTSGNKGRSTITASVNGVPMEGNAIYRDNTAYTWMIIAGNKMGFKFGQSELEELGENLTAEQRQQAEQVRQEMIFNCRPWTPDESKFVIPSDVNFE